MGLVGMWMGHVLQWVWLQGGDGISQVGVRLVDGTCYAGEGSYQGGDGTLVEVGVGEDLEEIGGLSKLTVGFFRKLWVVGAEEKM